MLVKKSLMTVMYQRLGEYHVSIWWCLDHHWMCCFGDNIRRLIIALQKVIERKAQEQKPEFVAALKMAMLGPIPPAKTNKPFTTIIDTSVSGLITITTDEGKITKIARKRVHSVKEYLPFMLELGITNKAGRQMFLQVHVKEDNKRQLLANMILEDIKFNEIRQHG
jgi:hypothetical protein